MLGWDSLFICTVDLEEKCDEHHRKVRVPFSPLLPRCLDWTAPRLLERRDLDSSFLKSFFPNKEG